MQSRLTVSGLSSPLSSHRPILREAAPLPKQDKLVPSRPSCTQLTVVEHFGQTPSRWGLGLQTLPPQRPLTKGEDQRLLAGVKTSRVNPLQLDSGRKYLFLVDDRGFSYVPEDTPCATPSGKATHPLIANEDLRAYLGGEMKLREDGVLEVNTRSGRYSSLATDEHRASLVKLLRALPKDPATGAPLQVVFKRDID